MSPSRCGPVPSCHRQRHHVTSPSGPTDPTTRGPSEGSASAGSAGLPADQVNDPGVGLGDNEGIWLGVGELVDEGVRVPPHAANTTKPLATTTASRR